MNNIPCYPAHIVRLVDPIVPGAVLTEAEEDGVDGHAVDTNEGVGDQVREQDGHGYLGPQVLDLFVFLKTKNYRNRGPLTLLTAYLQYVVRYDTRSNHHHNLAKEEDEGSNGVDGSYTKGIGCLEEIFVE